MAKQSDRPGLRERVEMRRRGIDPNAPKAGKEKRGQTIMKLTGITLQVITVFALLGYITYFVEQDRVQLSVPFLIIASALFIFGRLLTYLGNPKSGGLKF